MLNFRYNSWLGSKRKTESTRVSSNKNDDSWEEEEEQRLDREWYHMGEGKNRFFPKFINQKKLFTKIIFQAMMKSRILLLELL